MLREINASTTNAGGTGGFAFEVWFLEVPLRAAEQIWREAETEAQMFEPQASFCASRFLPDLFGNPEGAANRGRFFCLLFLSTQEK